MLVLCNALKWHHFLKNLGTRIPPAFWILVYFQVTLGSLLIFRAKSVHQVGDFLRTVFTNFGGFNLHVLSPSPKENFFDTWWPPARGALYASLFVLLLMGWSDAPAEFIYFKF